MENRELKRLVILLLLWKAAFFLILLTSLALLPGLFQEEVYRQSFHWPRGAPPTFRTHFQTWDANHYLFLAEEGYVPNRTPIGMFPLWPLLIRAGSWILRGSFFWSGLILANLLSLAGMVFIYRLALQRCRDREAADTALLIMLACPGALFFQFIYSESLFLLLAVILAGCLLRSQWWAAVLAGLLLPLTRGVGAFVMIPLLWDRYEAYRREGRVDWRKAPGALSPLLGVGIYFLLMSLWVGDPLAGFRVQEEMFISRRTVGGIFDLPGLLRSLFGFGSVHGFEDSFLDRAWFLVLLGCLWPLWKMDRRLFLLALAMGLPPAMTSFMAYTRYFMMAFPVFLVLGDLLGREERRGGRWIALAVLVGLQVLLTVRHVNFIWAG